MRKYILKRLLYLVITLLVVMTVTFFLMHSLPGTPFDEDRVSLLSPEQQAQVYARYGLDKPVHIQYLKYMGNMLRGDLGTSTLYAGRPVTDILASRIGPSVFVGVQAVLVGAIIGLVLGIIAAYRHNTPLDSATMVISVLGISVPNFVVAALLQYFLGLKWGLLPVAYWESYASSILPSLALSFGVVAQIARFTRTEMLTVLQQDYILMAKAKGLSPIKVLVRHALRNSLLPAITILGSITVNVLTGSLAVESIFSVPGIGSLFVDTIKANDYATILGLTVFYSGFYIVVMLLIDILYCVIDPRIRLAPAKE